MDSPILRAKAPTLVLPLQPSEEMVHWLDGPVLHSSPLMVVKKGEWIQEGMEQAQHTPWEWYGKNMGAMVKGEKLKSYLI